MSNFRTYPYNNSAILRVTDDRDIIDTSPEYQRLGDIWSLDKKQLLIDSIMNSYDVPKLYFHALQKPVTLDDGREVRYSIIDGRQRLEAIWSFMEDKFPLSEDFKFNEDNKIEAGGLLYSELANVYPKLKIRFDSFVLPIICVETSEIDLIEDMFSRLNEAVPLNAAEKRNAIGGPMAVMINEVAAHDFFDKKVKLRNTRYQYKEVAARLLFLEDSLMKKKLYDTKKPLLDLMVHRHKTDPTLNSKTLGDSVKLILNEMTNIFEECDSLLRSQSALPIYFLLFRSAHKQGRLNHISKSKLEEFHNKVRENREIAEQDIAKADFELLEYHNLSIQGTNDASSIKERLRIISEFFNIDPISLD
ncbi:DUF262 domain-containing protein [Nitrosopumilus sp.]|uniref:DUF262 domain-containing protein n=1 Tax=Nitrosopumilus sp. TaxID=2024843 RepID=UPI003D142469